ncbi:MAG: DUF2130 domain-containing protein [Thermodesulfovibrionales bacterium]|nr:DUF2130 domain-containing protein [Thermodesulfovibrionales bacterium]
MENKSTIRCPQCGREINVSEVLYSQLEEKIKKVYQAKEEELLEQQERLKESIEKEFEERLKASRTRIEEELRRRIEEEHSIKINLLQKELQEKTEKVKELHSALIEIEKLKREKELMREQITLEKEKELTEKLKEEREKLKRQVEESLNLQIKEKDILIEQLKSQLDEARRKAEQGSIQLKGEAQELELEKLLKSAYPTDEILEIRKGQRGADILQIVKTSKGTECGKIYYESKRAKNFDYNWIEKLKEDNLTVKADFLVIVSETLPDGRDRFLYKDGVWICSLSEVEGLSFVLRKSLQEIYAVKVSQQGKDIKMEMLYNYLTSNEFRGQFEAIIDGFIALQNGYQEEKRRMEKIWAERQKQIEKVISGMIAFYGSIKGIAGSSIPEIKALEGGISIEE